MLTENAGGKHMNDKTQQTDARRLEKEERREAMRYMCTHRK